MEKFQELREQARSKIRIADHLITQTYPMLQDPKLLLSAVESLFLAMSFSMGSLLHYELLFKRIPPFQDTFPSKYNMFQLRCSKRYNFDLAYSNLMQELKGIILQHKKSPVEFVRKDQLVICNEDYTMRTLSVEQLKRYVHKAKVFIEQIEGIVSKNETIFGRSKARA